MHPLVLLILSVAWVRCARWTDTSLMGQLLVATLSDSRISQRQCFICTVSQNLPHHIKLSAFPAHCWYWKNPAMPKSKFYFWFSECLFEIINNGNDSLHLYRSFCPTPSCFSVESANILSASPLYACMETLDCWRILQILFWSSQSCFEKIAQGFPLTQPFSSCYTCQLLFLRLTFASVSGGLKQQESLAWGGRIPDALCVKSTDAENSRCQAVWQPAIVPSQGAISASTSTACYSQK